MTEMRVVDLRSDLPPGLVATGQPRPRLSWQLGPGGAQQAFELQASLSRSFGEILATTGRVDSAMQVGIPAPGTPLESREVRHYRVRVATDTRMSEWSDVLTVEAGLLRPEDWRATAIGMPDDPGRARPSPAPLLRTEFELDGPPVRARMYVTSLGLYQVLLNGQAVADTYLAPGWTSYRHRLLVDTFDVTGRLRPGRNALGAVLGDGWYRGRLGWMADEGRGRYGRDAALLLQLEIELPSGRLVEIRSDETWKVATGEILSADIYDGSVIDLRATRRGWTHAGYDDAGWASAVAVSIDRSTLEPRSAPPVRAVETRPVQPTIGADGVIRIDTGQNLAGFLRLRARGATGDRVIVRHAEVLEETGALHTRALRSARATDEFILADDGVTVLEPPFTFHGFRYAEVETAADVVGADVVAISSDLPRRSRFSCSDERLDRLHENVLWSLRGNFVSLPTDCPQRDERLGWTGDAQAFAATASTLVECEAFWQSWLRDLALDQDDDLGVPSVVPDVVLEGEARFGRAGWADAATIVPWAVYESYGDPEILRRQFPSMRRWVESLMRRRGADGLLLPGFQFGDWLDPDAPSDRPWEAKCDSEFIANSYFSWSARLTADAADVIGEPAAGVEFRAIADDIAARTWAKWAPDVLSNQTGCAIALELHIAPAAERAAVAHTLAALVDAADGRVATGFLGTPLVLPALAAAGRFDSAYRMLLRSEAPSWLYQLSQGATTVWERWDAIRPDGSIHPGTMASPDGDGGEGHMLSFNHYAYGAVIDWIYRHLVGIAPDRTRPGYAHVIIEPQPAPGIDWASGAIDTRYGTVSVDWRRTAERLTVDISLPPGTTATFTPPDFRAPRPLTAGRMEPTDEALELGPGTHRLVLS